MNLFDFTLLEMFDSFDTLKEELLWIVEGGSSTLETFWIIDTSGFGMVTWTSMLAGSPILLVYVAAPGDIGLIMNRGEYMFCFSPYSMVA